VLDFNSAHDVAGATMDKQQVDMLRADLLARLPDALAWLLPEGRVRHTQFVVGDVEGNHGKSLVVALEGARAGLWTDFASGGGGDIFDLWAQVKQLDVKRDFTHVLASVSDWLGGAVAPPNKAVTRTPPMDDLGPWTHKWDYHDTEGNLIACVYRYDTPRGKEFRPWDVVARKMKTPEIRPLYNQPQVELATEIILVEGEKCADALITKGITATTAMNGASAPVDKTDWSPLAGKDISIWPDNDTPGREYAQRAAQAIADAGARSVTVLQPPTNTPDKWDAADAVEEGVDLAQWIASSERYAMQIPKRLEAFTLGQLMADESPIPDDLIEPRVLTPGGMLVLGGAPKVGKSDFILSMLTYMAAGESFLDLTPSKRLRIFYLQAEVQYHYLRERLKNMKLPDLLVWRAADNLLITPQLRLVLNDDGMIKVRDLLIKASAKELVDVIVIDPLRNLFDGGEDGASENDNNAMLYFLKQRVEKLRDSINPEAGIILVHHTKKLQKRQLIEDPFLSFSGASSLRGYYSTGMLLYRPDESQSQRVVTFELRNGPGLADKHVGKQHGKWVALARESERLTNQNQGEKLDAERRRKHDVILQLIFDEAALGRVYTIVQFAEAFEGRAGLGADRTIQNRAGVLATKGYLKFFRDGERYGKTNMPRSKFGYMCVENMRVLTDETTVDNDTGDVLYRSMSVLPTHYKCVQSGAALPVENPQQWIYHERMVDEN